MADPFAPIPSRLDLAFPFGNRDRVRDELRQLMSALEARLQNIEQGPAKTYAEELLALQQNARNAVTDALTPFFEDLSEIASLGGIFVATSTSLVTVGLGLKTFTVADEAARARFAPMAYMAAVDPAITDRVLLGEVTEYDRESGDLTINVQRISDSFTVGATNSAWNLYPSPPPATGAIIDAGTFGGMPPVTTRSPLQLRRSNIATDAPLSANLLDGELGINFRDGKLFWRDHTAAIQASRMFVGDIGDVALRSDTDQFSTWTTAKRNQALRNLRRMPSYQTAAWTVDAAADTGKLFIFESQANVACTLPSLATAGDGFGFELQTLNLNNRGGYVTLTPAGTDKIEGVAATFNIPTGQTVRIVADTAVARGWRILGLKSFAFLQRNVLAAPAAAMVLLLPDGFRSYHIKGNGIINASGSSQDFWIRASQDFGSSFASAASNYAYGYLITTANGTNPASIAATTGAGMRMFSSNNSTLACQFEMDFEPGRNAPKAQAIWHAGSANAVPIAAAIYGSGYCTGTGLGTNINALQFSWDGGVNISAGASLELFGVI